MSSFMFVLVGPTERRGTQLRRPGVPATDDVEGVATPPLPVSRRVAQDTTHEIHHERSTS